MGALSASRNWIVKDDILLKNAIEAGASLESLAKGAVSFSHMYTLRELQDRWNSLLYDPVISAQAAARIAEYEIELSTTNPGKANKFFNCKEDFPFQKRKIESVQNQYYAVRKRVCNEPDKSADFGFVTAACSCIAAGRECTCGARLELSQHHRGVQFIASGANNLHCYGQPGGIYNGGQDAYAEINGHHSFRAQHVGVVENEVKDGSINNDYIHGYSTGALHDHDCVPNNSQVSVRLQEPGSFRATDQHECSQAYDAPTWSAIPDVHASNMLADMHMKEKEQEILNLADDKKMNTGNSDDLSVPANLYDGISNPGYESPTLSENDLIDLRLIELLNCNNFLNSPHQMNEDFAVDTDTSAILDGKKTNMCSVEIDPNHEKHILADASEVDSIPASGMPHPGPYVECMLNTEDPDIPCNDHIIIPTEPPLQCLASGEQNSKHNSCSVSPATAPISYVGNSNAGCLALVKEKNVGDVQPSSHPMIMHSSTLEQKECMVAFNHGFTAGAKPSEGPSISGVPAYDCIDAISTNSCTSALCSVNGAEFGEDAPCGLGKHEVFDKSRNLTVDKSIIAADHMNHISLNIPSSYKPEIGSEAALQNRMSSHALSDLELRDPIATVSTSDQEKVADYEQDVPNYFDLEALILDMDLVPFDQGFDSIHPEVSRFQHLESWKSLIRLEQGAQSYMNRAIFSRGAFAILYGQHLKCYIKDPQVSLGRETEEVKVDIDLGKEGRANKISRQQAIIKMDEGGSFHIKNIGKCSIFVNGKEVSSNKWIKLSSDSLIEIREMRFIFHVNQDAVRQHVIRNMTRREEAAKAGTQDLVGFQAKTHELE